MEVTRLDETMKERQKKRTEKAWGPAASIGHCCLSRDKLCLSSFCGVNTAGTNLPTATP